MEGDVTEDEIVAVAKICLTADDWCKVCAGNLIEELQRAFPDWQGTIQGIWDKADDYRQLFNEKCEFGQPDPSVTDICL